MRDCERNSALGDFVGALVVGALVVGALVVGALVVGALVVGALVVGAFVGVLVGAFVGDFVGALVVGALVGAGCTLTVCDTSCQLARDVTICARMVTEL